MSQSNRNADSGPRPLNPKTKKQIALVFLMSMIFSSFLVFFGVYTRTQMANEQFKLKEKQQNEQISKPDESSDLSP